MVLRRLAAAACRGLPAPARGFSTTPVLRTVSDEYIPRNFPLKSTTGLAGIPVEPLWRPKILAAAAELQAYMKHSDIPSDSTYYNITMHLCTRIFKGIEDCQDDWLTLEKKYFWGWPVEYILQLTWRELETATRWNEWRFWELDPEQVKKIAREDQGVGKVGAGYQTPWEAVARDDYDKRKKALTQEEMAELKRMDTEKMARESVQYKERKERIKDDMERARGEMLKKFLNRRLSVDHELKRLQPGLKDSHLTSDDIIAKLKSGAAEIAAGGTTPAPPSK